MNQRITYLEAFYLAISTAFLTHNAPDKWMAAVEAIALCLVYWLISFTTYRLHQWRARSKT